MHPNLMHPSRERPAEHNARLSVEAESFEFRAALLAVRRHLANADFVADHFNRLRALGTTSAEEEGKIQSSCESKSTRENI